MAEEKDGVVAVDGSVEESSEPVSEQDVAKEAVENVAADQNEPAQQEGSGELAEPGEEKVEE